MLEYLRDLRGSAGEVEVNRVKLMLVGHGEAVKTALIQRLIYDIFDDKVDLTDGINVQAWEHAGVRFDVWDFGIQSSTA
jgi:GTPase SAR1 family protein